MNKYHVYFVFANGVTLIDTKYGIDEVDAIDAAFHDLDDDLIPEIMEIRSCKIPDPKFDLHMMCDNAMLNCRMVIDATYETALRHQAMMSVEWMLKQRPSVYGDSLREFVRTMSFEGRY